jgi:predicted phage terminase large subunit-like protein
VTTADLFDHELLARERIRRDLAKLCELAPTSLSAHATLFHHTSEGRPVIPARHHEEWVQFAHDVERYRWIVIICPPGYAKSTWWSVIYPTWRIGVTRGRVRIGLISNTANLTYGFARDIMKTVADPLFEQIYGVRPDYSRGWSQKQFWTSGSVDPRNPTVLATGIGGPIQGKRFDEIICDDLTTWEDARSDTVMEGQRHFLKALLMKRFPPGDGPPNGKGRMVVAMTRWAERDLVPIFSELGFRILNMPALGYWDRTERPDGSIEWGEEPLWPEMETRAVLEREREEDPLVFELVKQGNTSVVGGDVFETQMLNYGAMPPRGELTSIVQYVDTAGGKDRKKGDYFVLATVGLRGDQAWVLDIDRGRYPAPEQERRVITGGATMEDGGWEPEQIVVESKNEGLALYQRLITNTRLPLLAYDPVRDKEFRAIPFANAVNGGNVWIPLRPDGTAPRWARSLVAELDSFPRGDHDDQVDAVSGAFNHTGAGGPRLRVLTATGHHTRGKRF